MSGLLSFLSHLDQVDVYLVWFGNMGRLLGIITGLQHHLFRIPGYRRLLDTILRQLPIPKRAAPEITARNHVPSLVQATAYDGADNQLGVCTVHGHNMYCYTAEIIAWMASQILAGEIKEYCVVGPLRAFGLQSLDDAHDAIGFSISSQI